MLWKAAVSVSKGASVSEACRGLGVSGQSFYRWRREYGGIEVSQARRLKEFERESVWLNEALTEKY